jgi:hypothetical protein
MTTKNWLQHVEKNENWCKTKKEMALTLERVTYFFEGVESVDKYLSEQRGPDK